MTLQGIPTDFVHLSWAEFEAQFTDNWACVQYLMESVFPFNQGRCYHCGQEVTFYPLPSHRRFHCGQCRKVYTPTAGTICHKTQQLKKMFQAIWLLHHTPDMTILELRRQLGVTYKTAWRMADRIRSEQHPDYRAERRARRNITEMPNGKWRVRLWTSTRTSIEVGIFATFEEAVVARDRARKALGRT